MTPSAPVPPTNGPSAEPATVDIQTELLYLRRRNEELQLQLERLTNRRDVSAGTSRIEDGENGGGELRETEKTAEIGPNPDGTSHSVLHHRSILSGEEGAASADRKLPRTSTSPGRRSSVTSTPGRRSGVKSKPSDAGAMHTSAESENGYQEMYTPPGSSAGQDASSGKDGLDNESTIKDSRTKRTSDGGGRYFKALSIDHGDEEETRFPLGFPHVHVQPGSDVEDDYDDDNLVNDDISHNKHMDRNALDSTQSNSVLSSPSNSLPSFKDQIKERAGWLIGLMFLQSCSSFIIQYNETFLQNHMVIVQFLTMLVGAGGNAGNQASVRVIRSLAVGTLNARTTKKFLMQEAKMALVLSALIGLTGFIRAAVFRTPPGETIAVTTSVCIIVATSVVIGSTLPLGMKKVGIDPANASTSIQVIMDILGVLITVCVSSFVLDFKVFQNEDDSGTN